MKSKKHHKRHHHRGQFAVDFELQASDEVSHGRHHDSGLNEKSDRRRKGPRHHSEVLERAISVGHREGKRFFERGRFKFALLELLSEQEMHGYQIIKAMEAKTGGLYVPSAGSVYPNLQMLEDMGYIIALESEGKKLYQITEAGKLYLNEHHQQAESEDVAVHLKHGSGIPPHLARKQQKLQLRKFMKNWSHLVHLMAKVDEAATQAPESEHAKQFQQLMTSAEASLKEILTAIKQATIESIERKERKEPEELENEGLVNEELDIADFDYEEQDDDELLDK